MRREYEAAGGLAWLRMNSRTVDDFAPFPPHIRLGRRWRYIADLYVPERERRSGVGTDLLTRCIADADAEGVSLWLLAAPRFAQDRHWLVPFYEKHGFQVAAGVAPPENIIRPTTAMWRLHGAPVLPGAQPPVLLGRQRAVSRPRF